MNKLSVLILVFLSLFPVAYATNVSIIYAKNVSDGSIDVVGMTDAGRLMISNLRNTTTGGDNSSWNESYANTLYATIGSGNSSWNESFANTLYLNRTSESLYTTTFNSTYDAKVSYNTSWNQSHANTVYASIATVSDNSSWNESFANTKYLQNDSDAILSLNSRMGNSTDYMGFSEWDLTTVLGVKLLMIKGVSNTAFGNGTIVENVLSVVARGETFYTGALTTLPTLSLIDNTYAGISSATLSYNHSNPFISINKGLYADGSINVSAGNDICISDGNCLSTSNDNSSWNESFANTLYLNRTSEASYLSTFNQTYVDNNVSITANLTAIGDNVSSLTTLVNLNNESITANLTNILDTIAGLGDGNTSWNESVADLKFVPYTGANADVDLGSNILFAGNGSRLGNSTHYITTSIWDTGVFGSYPSLKFVSSDYGGNFSVIENYLSILGGIETAGGNMNAKISLVNVSNVMGGVAIEWDDPNQILGISKDLQVTGDIYATSGHDICINGGKCLSTSSENASWNESYADTLYLNHSYGGVINGSNSSITFTSGIGGDSSEFPMIYGSTNSTYFPHIIVIGDSLMVYSNSSDVTALHFTDSTFGSFGSISYNSSETKFYIDKELDSQKITSTSLCFEDVCIEDWDAVNQSGSGFSNGSNISVSYINVTQAVELGGIAISSWSEVNQSGTGDNSSWNESYARTIFPSNEQFDNGSIIRTQNTTWALNTANASGLIINWSGSNYDDANVRQTIIENISDHETSFKHGNTTQEIFDAVNNLSFYPYSTNPSGYLTSFAEVDPIGSTVGNWSLDKPNYATHTNVVNNYSLAEVRDASRGNWTAVQSSYLTSTQIESMNSSLKLNDTNQENEITALELSNASVYGHITSLSQNKSATGTITCTGTNVLQNVSLGAGSVSGQCLAQTGGVSGSGSTGNHTKWTGTSTIGNSLIYEDSSGHVGVGVVPTSTFEVKSNATDGITLNDKGNTSEILYASSATGSALNFNSSNGKGIFGSYFVMQPNSSFMGLLLYGSSGSYWTNIITLEGYTNIGYNALGSSGMLNVWVDRIGIGTGSIAPTRELDVVGEGNFTDAVYVGRYKMYDDPVTGAWTVDLP